MEYRLGEENSDISYVRYETPSAFRKAGAFLPKSILDMKLYKFRLSPYMGCSKRCQYCFELHNEFIRPGEVKIKTDTVATVREKISGMKERNVVLLDGYDCERAEIKERLIRSSLEVLLEFRMPLFIQTKSDLVLRDLDLLRELSEETDFLHVAFSMTDLNPGHNNIFEPYTCSPKNRLRAVKILSDAGISTGILLMPVLPFISDTPGELDRLFAEASGAGCDYIIPEPLRLTGGGPQREKFLTVLKKHYPQFLARYHRLYPARKDGYKFGSGPKDWTYMLGMGKRISRVREKYGIPGGFSKPDLGKGAVKKRNQSTLDGFV